jgi:hypothetical protein
MSVLFGRFFQLVGMVILPVGLLIGLSRGDLRTEEMLLLIGAGFFLVGWLMARNRGAR